MLPRFVSQGMVLGWALGGVFPRAMVHDLGARLRAAREAMHIEHTPQGEPSPHAVPLATWMGLPETHPFVIDMTQDTFTTFMPRHLEIP